MAGACDSVTKLLSPYVDDELAASDRAVVDEHLRGCSDCQGRLADLRATKAAMGAYFQAQAEAANFAGFSARVMQQIRKEPLPFTQRARLWWTELMAYHSTAIYSGFGAAVAAAAVAFIAIRPAVPAADNGLVVRSMHVENPNFEPVVMHTDDGESVIMFMEHEDSDDDQPAAAKPGAVQQPAAETPHGGNL